MGTRSITKVYEEYNGKKQLLLALYKQYDGYVKGGWGDELKKFMKSGTFVNGIPGDGKESKYFNGIGDFALQIVTNFKEGCGGIYATTEDAVEEFNYEIVATHTQNTCKVSLRCKEEPKFKYDVEYKTGWG